MKIVVFGASGRTGKKFIQQALKAGHEITGFVRDANKLSINHDHLSIVEGNALQSNDSIQVIEGHDAVISCLGANGLGKTLVLSEMTSNIIEGMNRHDVKRILYVASAGIYNEIPGLRGMIAMKALRNVLSDHRRSVDFLEATPFNWTIARPMRLDDGNLTTSYRTVTKGVPNKGSNISRNDVAHFLLTALENNTYLQQSVGLAY